MKTTNTGSLHRFHDQVALWLGNGETLYLDPNQALKIARALNKCAKEIKTGVKFQDSKINTIDFK